MSENPEDQLDMYAEAIANVYDLRKENDILIEMIKCSEEKCKKLKQALNTCWITKNLDIFPESA